MLDKSIVPEQDPNGDSPRMITFIRGGKEITAVTADDAREAVNQACIILLNVKELRVGDELRVTRI